MISIIIPVYNQATKLGETLQSISKQIFTDYEVIIVNDGSKDDPETVFQNFFQRTDTQNSYTFLNQENKGAPSARNRGWKRARGQYLLFCDSDASLKPDALELMYKALQENPSAAFSFPSFYWGNKLFKVGSFDEKKLRKQPYIHTMSLIRKQAMPINGWDESIKKLQDWDLYLTMMENNQYGVWVEKALFRVHPGGTMSTWIPAFAYKAFPFLPVVKKYNEAVKVIKKKHNL